MTNHDDGDESGEKNRNEDGDGNDNDAYGLGYDGLMFDPFTMLRSLLSIAEDDRGTMMMDLRPWPWCPMYLRV